jgi:hypothetical protein
MTTRHSVDHWQVIGLVTISDKGNLGLRILNRSARFSPWRIVVNVQTFAVSDFAPGPVFPASLKLAYGPASVEVFSGSSIEDCGHFGAISFSLESKLDRLEEEEFFHSSLFIRTVIELVMTDDDDQFFPGSLLRQIRIGSRRN